MLTEQTGQLKGGGGRGQTNTGLRGPGIHFSSRLDQTTPESETEFFPLISPLFELPES
jgi:hypothetical protein